MRDGTLPTTTSHPPIPPSPSPSPSFPQLSSQEGSKDQDEIDFEFLGNRKDRVQLNYYVNGVGGHELVVMLGFDCAQDYHQYTIFYNATQIV